MKNWLWALGISILFLGSCQGQQSTGEANSPVVVKPGVDSSLPSVLNNAPDYKEDENKRYGDTSADAVPKQSTNYDQLKKYKDNPGKTKSDLYFIEHSKMIDSLAKVQLAQNHLRDSIWRSSHPQPGDTLESRNRR